MLWADRRRLRLTWLRLGSALILRPLSGHIAARPEGSMEGKAIVGLIERAA
jgi:hypothetical protein